MEKQWKAQKHEEPSFEALKSFAISKIRNARRGSKEKICHEAFLMTVISATFGVLPIVQSMHALCRFEDRAVNNPMLQTVRKSKLK